MCVEGFFALVLCFLGWRLAFELGESTRRSKGGSCRRLIARCCGVGGKFC